jgi:hypothetical protein
MCFNFKGGLIFPVYGPFVVSLDQWNLYAASSSNGTSFGALLRGKVIAFNGAAGSTIIAV